MDLTPYIESLREDLATTVSAGDEQTRRAAAALSVALEPAIRLAIMNVLSDLAAEVTATLDQVVEVRLAGRDVHMVVTPTGTSRREPEHETEQPPPPPTGGDSAENISRMTVRMFEQIKNQAEQAAAAQGVSLNAFVSQAVQGALHRGIRARGWAGHHEEQGEDSKGKHGGESSRVHGWTEG
jgi:hypothetical protein